MEPDGFQHAAALADPLLFFQHELARAGADVTVGVNQLKRNAPNLVFGAHLGFDKAVLSQVECVFVNLEQTGAGGASLAPWYLSLLRWSATVDYHGENIAAYAQSSRPSHLVRFGCAPYLAAPALPLEERPIDVLFLGAVTGRRKALLQRLQDAGVDVVAPAAPIYGEDRDALVRRSKLVLNASAYPSARFEQVRASVVLSCGTPVVTEDRGWTHPDDAWAQQYVHHFDPAAPERFFHDVFRSPDFYATSRAQLQAWSQVDVSDGYRAVLATLHPELVPA